MEINDFIRGDKLYQHPNRVGQFLSYIDANENCRRRPFPITVELDMTNKCNSNCPHCAGGRNDYSELSLEQAETIITQIAPFCRGLIFTGGGEPLCNEHTLDAVKYAAYNAIDIGFITNGLLLSDEVIDVLLDHCVWIRISLDAGSPEVYAQTHGLPATSFTTVLENIARLTDAKKEKRSNTTIGTAFLTNESLAYDMENFIVTSKILNVDYAQFRPFHFDKYNPMPIVEELRKKYQTDVFKIAASEHKYMRMQNYKRKFKTCYGHNFATVIGADAKVYVCCHMRGNEKYILGDLNKEIFYKIWDSDQAKKVYNNIDFCDCVPLCRCESFNETLYFLAEQKRHGAHLNFL